MQWRLRHALCLNKNNTRTIDTIEEQPQNLTCGIETQIKIYNTHTCVLKFKDLKIEFNLKNIFDHAKTQIFVEKFILDIFSWFVFCNLLCIPLNKR